MRPLLEFCLYLNLALLMWMEELVTWHSSLLGGTDQNERRPGLLPDTPRNGHRFPEVAKAWVFDTRVAGGKAIGPAIERGAEEMADSGVSSD